MGLAFRGELGAKLARWVFFTVLISLAPIFLDYAVLLARDGQALPPIQMVLDHGELYLLSSAFLCVGLGEVIGSSSKLKVTKIVVSGLAVLILILAVGLYVASKNVDQNAGIFFSGPSVWFFIASCGLSTSCIALSGINDD